MVKSFKKPFVCVLGALVAILIIFGGTFSAKASETSAIQVTSPNGGEQWTLDTMRTITWTATNISPNIVDSGADWTFIVKLINTDAPSAPIILTNTLFSSARSYTFNLASNMLGFGTYKARVELYGNSSVFDESDAAFSIAATGTPSITVLSPNGGEKIELVTKYKVTWMSNGGLPSDSVNIDLYKNNQYLVALAQNLSLSDGQLIWLVNEPVKAGDNYKIRVGLNSAVREMSDYSDNYFSIVEAITPVTCVRETTKAGVTCGGYFYEDYCENLSDGTGYANKRKCNTSTGTDCSSLVNVDRTYCPYGCQNGVCKSVPSITVLSPNGGEQWQVGKTYSVTWKSSGLEQININLLSADPVNEGSYRVARLISNLSASIGNYSWAVPEKTECLSLPCITLPEHRNHKIEVVDARYGRNSSVSKVYSDTSDAPFSIVTAGTNLAPVIDGVTAPTQLKVNEQGTWTINARDPENGTLTYSVRWGDEVSSLTSEQRAFSSGAGQTTTFTHAYSKTGNYTINFTVTDDRQQTAKTSITIEVIEVWATTPSLTVISPNGGEQWVVGNTYDIKWVSQNLPKGQDMVVSIIRSDTKTEKILFNNVSNDMDIARWTIPADIFVGSYVLSVRAPGLSERLGVKVADDSDAPFSIVSVIPPCLLPDGTLVKLPGDPKIYVIRDCKKYWIQTPKEFTQSGYKWSDVNEYSSGTISSLPDTSISVANIPGGATIQVVGDPDVYVVKYAGNKAYKRLILSPSVFRSYGHLKWENIIKVDKSALDSFTTSNLVRAENGKVYKLSPSGDTGARNHVKDMTAFQRLGFDADSVYQINSTDESSYSQGQELQ
ncbi:hypothetical protein KKG29_00990 [Patescibacteria group bacterium]|nr:hypothetical protein [Patescibacteria group bacterium]